MMNNEVKQDVETKPSTTEMLENVFGASTVQNQQQKEEKSRFGFPQNNNYNVADYRSLVKILVCAVKSITWGCSACKVSLDCLLKDIF